MRLTLLLLLLSVATLAACNTAKPLTEEDKAAMRASTDSFNLFFRTDRDSAIAAGFTETAVMLPPNVGIVEGRAAILAFFQSIPAIPDFTGQVIEIDGRGDLAYVRGIYTYTAPAVGRIPAYQDHGKFVEIRRRQADGRWLVAVDIFNSNVPPPPAR
jgi:ketosteroid isomerase-like protein